MFENTMIESPFYIVYKIKKGDTLYKISKEFNVNTKLLAELNGLNIDDYIYPEQMILVPKKNVSYYITKDGDTLDIVSKIFNVKQEDIILANETIYLMPGQMIYYNK
jgi:membrane-bound lytic murein transglycosylase D